MKAILFFVLLSPFTASAEDLFNIVGKLQSEPHCGAGSCDKSLDSLECKYESTRNREKAALSTHCTFKGGTLAGKAAWNLMWAVSNKYGNKPTCTKKNTPVTYCVFAKSPLDVICQWHVRDDQAIYGQNCKVDDSNARACSLYTKPHCKPGAKIIIDVNDSGCEHPNCGPGGGINEGTPDEEAPSDT